MLDAGTWPRPPIVEAEGLLERGGEEHATLGLTLSVDHPLALYGPEHHVGQRVTLIGIVVAGQRIRTSGGRPMAFASLCDRTGVVELTFSEQAAERYGELLHVGTALAATGTVTEHVEHGIGLDTRSVRVFGLEREAAEWVEA